MIGTSDVHMIVLTDFERGDAGWLRVLEQLSQRNGHPLCPADLVRPPVGKPHLQPSTVAPPLEFNLSHSGATALLAISCAPVGVDLEIMEPAEDLEGIVEQFFSVGERRSLPNAPGAERTRAIYRIWVRKEAYLKARGMDLGADLPAECSVRPARPWTIHDCPLPIHRGHHAALATMQSDLQLKIYIETS